MGTVKVVVANAHDSFGQRHIYETLTRLRADVIVVPEAFHEDKLDLEVLNHIANFTGYDVHYTPYDDRDGRKDRHVLVMLVRELLRLTVEVRNLESRKCLVAWNDTTVFAGVHFDDRRQETRNKQAVRLLEYLHQAHASKTQLVFGDINQTPPNTRLGRLFRTPMVESVLRKLPVGMPGDPDQSKLARIGSLTTRMHGQTSGELYDLFDQYEFKPTGSRHATMCLHRYLPIPVMRLDEVFVRNGTIGSTYRLPIRGTDYLAISAVVSTQ